MATQDRNRLIVTGCSYTSYCFPTYADFLGVDYSKYLNLGSSGAGNRYVFHCLSWIFRELELTENDVVIGQWSSIGRYDFIRNNDTGYVTPGNLNWQDEYDHKWVDNHFNIVQSAYDYLGYVESIAALGAQSKATYINLNMFDPWAGMFYGEPMSTDIFNKYLKYINRWYPKKTLKKVCDKLNFPTSVEEYQWLLEDMKQTYCFHAASSGQKERQEDTHPTVIGHHKYAQYIDKLYNLGGERLYDKKTHDVVNQIYDNQTDPDYSFEKSRGNKLYEQPVTNAVSIDIPGMFRMMNAKGKGRRERLNLERLEFAKKWIEA